MFPHIGSKWDTVYNDFNYWKPEMQEIELPPEIYDSLKMTQQSQGMIRTLTESISGGSGSESNRQSRANTAPASISHKSHDSLSNKGTRRQHMFYVGGDVDMPGRMDILPKNNGGGTMIGYYEAEEDGDDEYLTDDQEDYEEDIPTEIDLSDIPY